MNGLTLKNYSKRRMKVDMQFLPLIIQMCGILWRL